MTSPPLTRAHRAGTATASPVLEADRVVFRLADPDRRHAAVAVYQELTRPRDGLAAAWSQGVWTASLPRPDRRPDGPLRMEYAFVVDHADGGREFLVDPANPLRAEGAFGAKSVIEFPGYRSPTWADAPIPSGGPGAITWVDLPLPRFDAALPCGLWQPAGVDAAQPLPLLIVHDGPEYDQLAGLTRLLAWAVATGRIPPLRAALLDPVPGQRDHTYSAAARYADGLVFTALGWLARTAPQPPDSHPVLMGASLGALAALHAAHRHPGRFGGLFLQSGSYFTMRTDRHERDFTHFDRVSRFVRDVVNGHRVAAPLPITMTCGTVEENLANNGVMAEALRAAGHDVTFVPVRDGHTYTAWRDALDPHLLDLLAR